jgi:hypothetical protein
MPDQVRHDGKQWAVKLINIIIKRLCPWGEKFIPVI